MKIERLNENQIRCTLNKSDLASRQLKINELAYGSDKAKELFRDMMQQASYELGFEAEDTPVMIEAIPISSECIVLIVTKVDNPEELDTRFSRFSPSDSDMMNLILMILKQSKVTLILITPFQLLMTSLMNVPLQKKKREYLKMNL